MPLFALTAFTFGWIALVPIAGALLKKRTSPCHAGPLPAHGPGAACPIPGHIVPLSINSPLSKLASASALCCTSCLGWAFCTTSAGLLAFLAASACLLVAACCDCKARIIPWETSLFLLADGAVFALFEYGAEALPCSAALAAAVVGALLSARLLARRLGRPDPIGMGDVRTMPGLFMFGSVLGSVCGAFSCSLSCCATALATILRCRARGAGVPRGIPLAPGFVVWLCVSVACT